MTTVKAPDLNAWHRQLSTHADIQGVSNTISGAARLADITAEAFADDPFNAWVFGDVRRMRNVFFHLARQVYVPAGYGYTLGPFGACMWLPPGLSKRVPFAMELRIAAGLLARGGPSPLLRAMASDKVLRANRPAMPHAYLFTIGLVANARGRGLGSTLIQPVLSECDARGWSVYLESSNPDNYGYYAAKGFETTGVFAVGASPPVEGMIRQPR